MRGGEDQCTGPSIDPCVFFGNVEFSWPSSWV
jgi:hypothetical protein